MANLKSLSRTNGFQRGNDAIAVLLSYSPLLNFLDSFSGFELDGTAFAWRNTVASHTIQNRALGASYSATDLTPADETTGSLYFQGGRVDVDVSHLADRDLGIKDIPVWFEKKLKKELIAFAKAFEVLLMNGAGSGGEIKGLIEIVDGTTDLPGYTSVTRTINAASYDTAASQKSFGLNMANTNYATNKDKFLELLYACMADMDQGSGMGMLMNAALFARMQTIARTEHILGEDRNLFGVPVPTFNGVPMICLTDTAITSTEPDDTATPVEETTSLWFMSPGEMRASLVTNSGLEYWEYDFMQAKESGSEKWEIRSAWKLEESKAILRLRNIKLG